MFVFTLGKAIELVCMLRKETQKSLLYEIGWDWAGHLLTSLINVMGPLHSYVH
jgi:hypothetical protein